MYECKYRKKIHKCRCRWRLYRDTADYIPDGTEMTVPEKPECLQIINIIIRMVIVDKTQQLLKSKWLYSLQLHGFYGRCFCLLNAAGNKPVTIFSSGDLFETPFNISPFQC